MQVPLPEKSLGRWVISGGLGALGSVTTHWLASQGGSSGSFGCHPQGITARMCNP